MRPPRRGLLAFPLLLLPAQTPAQGTPAAPGPRYSVSWWDAAAVGTAGALYLLPGALGLPKGAPSCAPCDPATLPAIDRGSVHAVRSGPEFASNLVLVAVAGWTAFAGLAGLPAEEWRGNVVTYAEAASWTAASTVWVQALVRRKRPVLYTSGAAEAASDPESQQSFPSTHAALAFAAATSYLVIARREHLPHAGRNAALLYAGGVLVSVLRVAAAEHFPTDVMAGAALGSGVGWLVPTLHATLP